MYYVYKKNLFLSRSYESFSNTWTITHSIITKKYPMRIKIHVMWSSSIGFGHYIQIKVKSTSMGKDNTGVLGKPRFLDVKIRQTNR